MFRTQQTPPALPTQDNDITTLSVTQAKGHEEVSLTGTSSSFSTFNALPISHQFLILFKIHLLFHIFSLLWHWFTTSARYLATVTSFIAWSPSFTFFHHYGLYICYCQSYLSKIYISIPLLNTFRIFLLPSYLAWY